MNVPDQQQQRLALARLSRLAWMWEELLPLPLIHRRFGLDAIVGLVPGLGDVAGALVASWGLVEAARLRVPPAILSRMLLNIGIDAIVGAIPLLGDIFDVGWRAQGRNLRLLKHWLADPDRARRSSTLVLFGFGLGLGAILVLSIWLAVWLVFHLVALLVPGA